MLLSALLGTLGSVSLMAQSTNVYSLNAVGYINITVEPGFNIISCPLMASPDNTINTLLTNSTGQFKKWQFWSWNPLADPPAYVEDIGAGSAWANAGVETLNPGQAGWLYNPSNTPVTITFVGTVPSGSLTNTLVHNTFNLVSSILPTSGDIVTNTLMNFTTGVKKDQVWEWTPGTSLTSPGSYVEVIAGTSAWSANPVQATVGGGFWYLNNTNVDNNWVENFSVGQ
jgi:hypothetical protein